MNTHNRPKEAPTETPVITPTKPEIAPRPDTPFTPQIEPDTTPKG